MLYHWYELDLEAAAPARAKTLDHHATLSDIARYSSAAAIARAKGGGVVMPSIGWAFVAANDTQPDAVAVRLRASGVGMIGHPADRVRLDDGGLVRRLRRLGSAALSSVRNVDLPAGLQAGRNLFVWLQAVHRRMRPDSGLTMVSNEIDGGRAPDGAQLQRCEMRGRQSTN